MVRSSDIISVDKKSTPKMPASERDLPAKDPIDIDKKSVAATNTQASTGPLPADTVREEIRTCYKQLFEQTIDIRGRVLKNQEINPSPVITIFRHIIDHNLIDPLFEYANSIPDNFGPPSQIISVTLAHLKVGIKMGYSKDKLLESGFAALLHNADMDDLPDRILQGNGVLSPDDIAAIKKHPYPTLDILTRLFAKTSDTPQAVTKDLKEPLASEVGEEYKDLFLHHINTGHEQEVTDKMEESDNAYKELAEIATEKKARSAKLFLGLVALAVIVVGIWWLSGILSSKTQEPTQIASEESKPDMHKKKISQPIKMPEPGPCPAEEASSPPDEQIVPEKNKTPLSEEKPAKTAEKPEPVPVAVKPSPSPPHQALKTEADVPPAPTISYPYSLHMSSYQSATLAEKAMAESKQKGLSSYWTRVDLGAKGVWYRVFVGHFETAKKADEFQKRHGIKASRILKTGYAVQVGTYTSKEELDQKISTLKKTGHCPYTIEQPRNQYQLLIGAYQTRRAAEKLAARLKESGMDCEMILR